MTDGLREGAGNPLEGIRVIDLSRILAGPFATMILGDLGAEVIKVERPGTGDDTRHWGPPFKEGVATYFLAVNRNKKSVTLDFSVARGRQVLWELLEESDVLVSNFRPGVLAGLGFSWEALSDRCPRLVSAEINGYGATGRLSGRPALDLLIQAESGLMDLTGEPGGPPTKVGISLADEVAGLYLVQGVLAALLSRAANGRGRRIEIALHDAMLSMFTYQAQQYLVTGAVPERMGSSHPSLVPYRPFASADGLVVVAVTTDAVWKRFATAVGLVGLADDARFASNALRVQNRVELERHIEDRLSRRSTDEWIAVLAAVDVPCGQVRTLAEALDGEASRLRHTVRVLEGGALRAVGSPLRFSGAGEARSLPPPSLGEHTVSVLAQLGYSGEEIGRLQERGVV